MDVILDTNIYTALLRSQGRNIFSSNAFVELFTYLRRTKSNLILPGPVYHEIIKEYSDLISSAIKKAQDAWTTLQRNTMSDLIDCLPPKRNAELSAFKDQLSDPGIGFEVLVLEDYKDIDLGEVVRRGVNRIRPANDTGEELRDVVIWLVALSHAKATSSKVAFVTDDGHFKGPDGNLHPDLLHDLATHRVELLYYDSLSTFVRANSLELSTVSADEIALLVSEGEIADLVTERFRRADLEDAMVSNIHFQEAQKYKVGDDSFYVEAKYTTVVRYSRTTTPLLNSVWNSGSHLLSPEIAFNVPGSSPRFTPVTLPIQAGVFSGIGRTVPLSYLAGTTVKENYEAVVNLALSFRTVSGRNQSVEVIGLEIKTVTQVSETPITPPEDASIT